MPRRKYSRHRTVYAKPRRRRSYFPRFTRRFHRRLPKRVPMEMLAGAIAIPFTPGYPDSPSPIAQMQSGDFQGLMSSLVHGFTGFNIGNGQWNVQAINPFDFSAGRYWKLLFWTGMMGTIRKKLVPKSSQLLQRIPFLGKYIT